MVFDLNEKELPKIGIQDVRPADILICIPSTLEGERIKKEIDKARNSLSEKIRTVLFQDLGDELANMRYAEKLARETGARMAVPVRRDAKTEDIIKEIKAGFLENVARDLFRLVNPDLSKLDKTSAEFTSEEELQDMLSRVSGVLSNTVSKELFSLSVCNMNMRMKNITEKVLAFHEPTDMLESHLKNHKGKSVISITAGSLGEVKMLAEAHRQRMRFAKKLNPNCATVRLHVRLVVGEEDKETINNGTKAYLIERMGVDDVLTVDDLVLVDEGVAVSPDEVYSSFKTENFEDVNIAIVDKFKQDRNAEKVPQEVVFMEYDGLATPRVYDAALELLAHRKDNYTFELRGVNKDRFDHWYFLPRAEEIETEELRNELMRYKQAITAA
jgi:hypothetical protein